MDAAQDAAPVTAEPTPVTRVTVALTPKAAADLASLQERTGLSKTDAINRAVSLLAFVEDQMRAGAEVLVRRGDVTERVHLL